MASLLSSISVLQWIMAYVMLLVDEGNGKDCGPPGRPLNGSSLTSEKFFYPGEWVSFECQQGFVLFGPERRECDHNGQWTHTLPTCQENLALNSPSSQSETLWSYTSSLAVDGDPNTCSFTPQSDTQRWWQVRLKANNVHVGQVAVTLSPGSYQRFSIFVVHMSNRVKANYRPCATFQGRFQEAKKVFRCNEGHGQTGDFVYVRDDRDDKEYFGICELEVFRHQERAECGLPEEPLYGDVEVSADGSLATYSCFPGFSLTGQWTRNCSFEGWTDKPPECQEVHCSHPESTEHGFIEVSNFKGSYVYGSKASYKCNPGFIAWGNTTRLCNAQGQWTGSKPLCRPIACATPKSFEHASVALVNGSSVVDAVAVYECIKGYKREWSSNESILSISRCLKSGFWSEVSIVCVPDHTFFDAFDKLREKSGHNHLRHRVRSGQDGRQRHDLISLLIVIVSAAVIAAVAILFGAALLRRGWRSDRLAGHRALESGLAKSESGSWRPSEQQDFLMSRHETRRKLNAYSTLPKNNTTLATLADGCVSESASLSLPRAVLRGRMIDGISKGNANDAFASLHNEPKQGAQRAPLVSLQDNKESKEMTTTILPDLLPRVRTMV